MKIPATALFLAMSGTALAAGGEIPLDEQGFVDRMQSANKAEIVAQLGDPAKVTDITDDETGEVVASIWLYHYLNFGDNGDYYKTTELDFKGERVVTVLFSTREEEASGTAALGSECPAVC